jgi:hypothetical protein
MVISADFEKQKQYFEKNIALSMSHYFFYRSIACENLPSDDGLNEIEVFSFKETDNFKLASWWLLHH